MKFITDSGCPAFSPREKENGDLIPALEFSVHLGRETVWLNRRQMAELFEKDTDTIGLHIRNVPMHEDNKLSLDGFYPLHNCASSETWIKQDRAV